MNGVELLLAARRVDLDIPVVLITGTPNVAIAARAIELGALRYLTKPIDHDVLGKVVRQAVRLGRLARVKRPMPESSIPELVRTLSRSRTSWLDAPTQRSRVHGRVPEVAQRVVEQSERDRATGHLERRDVVACEIPGDTDAFSAEHA